MIKVIFLFLLPVIILNGGCFRLQSDREDGFYVSAWYVPYDYTRGFASFSQNTRLIDEINPVWYNLNPEYFSSPRAPFVTCYPPNKKDFVSVAKTSGIKILPTIQNWGSGNFDATNITKILNDSGQRAKHVREIVNLVLSAGYDGIDIDYESLPAGDRDVFSAFIAELGAALREHDKLLSVAIYAKTTPGINWAGAGAQDWPKLARSADLLKVMAYDYHWSSFHPGPISPVDWLQDILNYSRTIPELKGKLLIGLPLYGLNWGAGPTAKEIMYNEAVHLLAQTNSSPARDNIQHQHPFCYEYYDNVEPYFTYTDSSGQHTVYYQDSTATRARLAVIDRYGDVVKGVGFWRLGGEDPAVWTELTPYK